MAKRFYLATRKDRSAQAAAVEAALKARGWEQTFAWTSQDEAGPEKYAETALAELEGVRQADCADRTAARRLRDARRDRGCSCTRKARHSPRT